MDKKSLLVVGGSGFIGSHLVERALSLGWSVVSVGLRKSLFGIEDLTMQKILGWVFSPIMYLLSIPWDEAQAAGALFGEKLVLNEFVAFSHLTEYLSGMSEKTIVIVTFSLCGFANFASIGIQIGGIGALAPKRKGDLARLGFLALIGGTLASLFTAVIVGMLI